MALGRRRERFQQELMVPTSALPRSPGHPFYVALNKWLAEAGFHASVESLCEPLYREGGRSSIPPGVYFRMLASFYKRRARDQGIAHPRVGCVAFTQRFEKLQPRHDSTGPDRLPDPHHHPRRPPLARRDRTGPSALR
jgi:hypothetical protein